MTGFTVFIILSINKNINRDQHSVHVNHPFNLYSLHQRTSFEILLIKISCRKAAQDPVPSVPSRKPSRKRWCNICNKMIKGGTLKRHMLEHHKIGKRPDISCDVCGKKYTRDQALRAHTCRG